MISIEIKGFEGRYEIFQDCTIISLLTNKPICQWKDNVGYLQVKLKKNGKNYYKRVHRLVAEHFIENPNNLPQVNHIDGDKTNNNINNLEWTNNKANTKHGYDNNLYHSKHRCIGIKVFDKYGNYLNTYKSIREAADQLNINRKTLSRILFDSKVNNYNYLFEAIL
ncbi:NUMOD1 domain-containing DNA-binding protein [Clostridium cuniculi]|uniref:NUMOD1 domain-containing DNA-binding protein n=1 Tax=Clostridium cuniculi TaxID=2548455 RepID=UPI00140FC671|nr:NUMOD1 domain-containing DNA-binding protein [Clostridium cuniculi]